MKIKVVDVDREFQKNNQYYKYKSYVGERKNTLKLISLLEDDENFEYKISIISR